jgi:hypothetical protein
MMPPVGKCVKCKRVREASFSWNATDGQGRSTGQLHMCVKCHAEERAVFQAELKDPNSRASKILKGILDAVSRSNTND